MLGSIIVNIAISKKGERYFFQVNVASDIAHLFDMQAAITGISANVVVNNVAGILKLQSENRADVCYSSVVTFGASPVETLLPGIADVNTELISLFVTPYYENNYREVPKGGTMDSFTLYGCYEDMIGKQLNQNLNYTVTLCFWAKTAENKKA